MGLDSSMARASERKSDDLGSIHSRDTDSLLRLTLTALRVSVTPSHSFNNNNNNDNNNINNNNNNNLLKKKDSIMRCTKLQKMVVITCDVHKPL